MEIKKISRTFWDLHFLKFRSENLDLKKRKMNDILDGARAGETVGLSRKSDKNTKGAITNQPMSKFEELQYQRN